MFIPQGVSLMDFYAGLAMHGLMSGALANQLYPAADPNLVPQVIATRAYELALAMLRRREKLVAQQMEEAAKALERKEE